MTEEPKPYLKNWIAFKVLIEVCIEDSGMPHQSYFEEKFKRYVLSRKEDEYKWGLHPLVLARLYRYFDKRCIPLDSDEQKAKVQMTEDEEYVKPYDRRWEKDR